VPKIINAKIAGHLHTLVIVNDKFTEITKQSEKVGIASSKPIREVGIGAVDSDLVIDAGGNVFVPAAIDPHVHSRDPGFPKKETWTTLARAAYRGGVSTVCDMPNTNPSTISREMILDKAKRAEASGLDFGIFLGVSEANIDSIEELLSDVSLPICGVKVFYGKSTGSLVYSDLARLQEVIPEAFSKPIVFHSEDQSIIDKNTASLRKEIDNATKSEDFVLHSKVRSSDAAVSSTKVILEWAVSYGRPVHFAHVSTAEEARLISAAANSGTPVTMEVAPHHLIFSTDDYREKGSYIKMNPPVRSVEEVKELRELVGKGIFSCFGTDHAPHTIDEKAAPLSSCPSGIPSIELFWPLIYKINELTGLSEKRAIEMATTGPAEMFGFSGKGSFMVGGAADFVCLETKATTVIREETVAQCGWSPYEGQKLPCAVVATWHKGRCAYSN